MKPCVYKAIVLAFRVCVLCNCLVIFHCLANGLSYFVGLNNADNLVLLMCVDLVTSFVLHARFRIDLEQAKEVHRSLKMAAGMFLHVKEVLLPKLPPSPEKGNDTDTRVVEAYVLQSQAEAQEGRDPNVKMGLPLILPFHFSFFFLWQLP